MENIKELKSRLEEVAVEELNKGIENVDCKEMSETIDMIKDLAMAMYYCSIVKGMEDAEYGIDYTHPTPIWNDFQRRGEYNSGKMYYTETEHMGKSGMVRMKYMQEKDMADTSTRMQHLEDYAKVLSDDILEMLETANENEKAIIRNKMQVLATRI